MELQKETNPKSKKKIIFRILKIVGVLFVCFIAYAIGVSQSDTVIDGMVKTQGDILNETEKAKAKLEKTEKKIASAESQYGDKEKEVKEALALVDKKDDLIVQVGKKETELEGKKSEIARLDKKIKAKQSDVDSATAEQKAKIEKKLSSLNKEVKEKEAEVKEKEAAAKADIEEKLSSLNAEVKSKEAELAKLESGIQAKKEAPVQLNAGQYVVGHDVKEGRYKATNIGRGTNFIVYGEDGSAVVNTILGTENGSGDYVFFATEGQIIQTEGQVKLIPVE
mgnify:CR=1 FL=1